MANLKWRRIGRTSRKALVETRLEAHYAAQALARAAHVAIQPKPDDSHTNLGWDDALDALLTHEIDGDLQFALRLAPLTLLTVKSGSATAEFQCSGTTPAAAAQWVKTQLAIARIPANNFDVAPPYDMPDHKLAKGAIFGIAKPAAFKDLAHWFANANAVLSEIAEASASQAASVSPVRCWPHHFDIAALISLDADGGENARSINAGLSPGDDTYDEPYFYVSPWPHPDAAKLPDLPIGHWRTEGFTAAILTQREARKGARPLKNSRTFLHAAVEANLEALR